MKSKTYLFSSLIAAIFLVSCQNFNELNFEDYNALTRPSNVANYEYTIQDGDFSTIAKALNMRETEADSTLAKMVKSSKIFSAVAVPSELLPFVLKEHYYTVDVNSAANVTYQYQENRPEALVGLSQGCYTLERADYTQVWGEKKVVEAFSPMKSPEANLSNILKNRYPEAVENTQQFIAYNYSETEPVLAVSDVDVFFEDFEKHGFVNKDTLKIDGWENINVQGKLKWAVREYGENFYIQMSSYKSDEVNEVWAVTPISDLAGLNAPNLGFDVKIGYYNAKCLSVKVSDDFAGDVKTATWTDITASLNIPAPNSGYSESTPNDYALSKYAGKKVTFAFVYLGDGANKKTTTVQLDNIRVFDKKQTYVAQNPTTVYSVYTFASNAWSVNENVVVPQLSDYEKMGKTALSASKADNYLPIYLAEKYPYAQAKDEKTVVFKTSKTGTYASNYTFADNVWQPQSTIESKTDQFVFTGFDKKGWIFDPTIRFTATKENFMIVIKIQKDLGKDYAKYDDSEFYYGFSAHYLNISYREIDRQNDPSYPIDGTEEEKIAFLDNRTNEGLALMLGEMYPEATPTVDGVTQFAVVGIQIYDGTRYFYDYKFKCVGDKKWEFVERTETKK